MAWHSCALFINDNVATQIDSLGHITTGEDNHWYNGFTEAEWGGNFGIRKADASTIPPIVVRGILIDVAGNQGVEVLKGGTAIGPKDLEAALEKQGTRIRPGDAVFVRTGTLRYWGKAGGDHRKLAAHDSAGINLEAAKWLVEEKGAIMVGSDTSGLEVGPAPAGSTAGFTMRHHTALRCIRSTKDHKGRKKEIPRIDRHEGRSKGHEGVGGSTLAIKALPRRREGTRGADRREKELSGGDRPREKCPPGSAGVPPASLFLQTACHPRPLPCKAHQTRLYGVLFHVTHYVPEMCLIANIAVEIVSHPEGSSPDLTVDLHAWR